ncbi:MAG: PcfB family protein [Eubacteriaceae bacterium]|nr:PcfB family protein [Eubacteriaceae bacterium]
MNSSADAAEQVVRISLDGAEVALRITGDAAKNILTALYAILRDSEKQKTRGAQRLRSMLRSGKELKVFTVKESDLKRFTKEAKKYGVVYCVLRHKRPSADGIADIMVRAEDAGKINRIVERFNLSTVDAADIRHEIQRERAERGDNPLSQRTEKSLPSESISEKLSEIGKGTSKRSVRDELRKIREARKEKSLIKTKKRTKGKVR